MPRDPHQVNEGAHRGGLLIDASSRLENRPADRVNQALSLARRANNSRRANESRANNVASDTLTAPAADPGYSARCFPV
jgi:hypothetical protein